MYRRWNACSCVGYKQSQKRAYDAICGGLYCGVNLDFKLGSRAAHTYKVLAEVGSGTFAVTATVAGETVASLCVTQSVDATILVSAAGHAFVVFAELIAAVCVGLAVACDTFSGGCYADTSCPTL